MENLKLYSINEVAEILNVSRVTVTKYIQDNKLKATKMGNKKQSRVRIKETDLKAFIDMSNTDHNQAEHKVFANESDLKEVDHKETYTLQEIRELKGYTSKEIAEHLKISVKKYESYESTQEAMGSMDVDYLIMLSMLYEIKPSQFSYLNESSNN